MTIASTPRKAGPLLGNGSATAFPFAFKVFSAADIQVVVADDAGVETVLTLGTHYTVTLNSNQETSPGGTITYPVTGAPLLSGSTLAIIGDVDYDQPLDLPSGGNYSPQALENQLDRIAMQVQQLKEIVGRSLQLSVNSPSDTSTALPPPEANTIVAWNAAADGLQNIDPVTLATVVAFGTAVPDIFTGTGVQTAFTLSSNPGALGNLDVAVGGATQLPGVDYFWTSGTSISFAEAPADGVPILVRYIQALPQGATDSASSTFIPDGGVYRNVQGKLRETVSVKDFGAKGDGVTDDTAAINAAVDSLASIGGGRLHFPAGIYMVSLAVNLRSNIEYYGDGEGATIIRSSTSSIDNVMGEGYPNPALKPFINVVIRELTIDGNQANVSYDNRGNSGGPDDAYQNGIRLDRFEKCLIENVTVKNTVQNGISIYFYSNDVTVRGCTVYDIGKSVLPVNGIYSYNGVFLEFNTQRTRVENNRIYNTRQHGIRVSTGSNGIVSAQADNLQADTIISGNYIKNTVQGGISVYMVNTHGSIVRPTITNNHLESCGTGAGNISLYLSRYDASGTNVLTDAVIGGNIVISNPLNRGFAVVGGTRAIICKNVALNNSSYGMDVNQCDTIVVSDNILSGNNGGGAQLRLDSNTNQLAYGNNPEYGMTVTGPLVSTEALRAFGYTTPPGSGTLVQIGVTGGAGYVQSYEAGVLNQMFIDADDLKLRDKTFTTRVHINTDGRVILDLPTSSAGLPAGALWKDAAAGNVIKQA